MYPASLKNCTSYLPVVGRIYTPKPPSLSAASVQLLNISPTHTHHFKFPHTQHLQERTKTCRPSNFYFFQDIWHVSAEHGKWPSSQVGATDSASSQLPCLPPSSPITAARHKMTRVGCMAPSVAISSNRENTRPHSHSRPSAQGPGDRPPHCPRSACLRFKKS